MEILILWFALSVIAAVIASNKGRSGFGFFLLAILLSPLVGILAALVASPATGPAAITYNSEGMIEAPRTCPFCAEIIQPAAIVCKHCGRDLPALAEPAPSAPIPAETEAELMKKYGITYNEKQDKYHYQDNRYADLRDAISFAKSQISH